MNAEIRAAREKAGRLLEQADALRQEYAGKDWPADIDEKFSKLLEDQTAAQERAEALTARAQASSDLDERLAAFREPAAKAPAAGGPSKVEQNVDKRAEAHREAFSAYLKAPTQHEAERNAVEKLQAGGFEAREVHALLGTNDNLGGFLVNDEFSNEVLKDLAGFSVMRQICRTMTTASSALTFPTVTSASTNDADMYSSDYQGSWRAEGYLTGGTAPTVQNQPTFGQTRIPVHVWQPDAIELTQELLADSGANLDALLASVIAETRAMDEESAFISGNGVNRPKGLTTEALTDIDTASAGALGFDDFVSVFVDLPAQYRGNSTWLMSSPTWGAALKLLDSAGQPMVPLFSNAPTQTIFGRPVRFNEFMTDFAASTTADIAVLGDFRFYGIVDRQGLRVQRLTERYAPNIGILPHARVGGQVLRTAAFRALDVQ